MAKKKALSASHRGPRPEAARPGPRKQAGQIGPPAKLSRWPSWLSAGAIREFVESVVIAFALAFLFRTFEAEAFVIPTGSMAPTLMGRHKDLVCPKCGYPFQASASAEVDSRTGRPPRDAHGDPVRIDVITATCPMCRYSIDLSAGNPQGERYRSFKGDRILVAKFPYHLADPKRWDVAVFMYPGEAGTNYIKRVIGLPGETIRIRRGDVFVRPEGSQQFTTARKSPRKILATMQPVYDNDYVLPDLIRQGWPARWDGDPPGHSGPGGWQVSEDLKSFRTDGTAGGPVWLCYRHYVPTYLDWLEVLRGRRFPRGYAKPQLITDFAAYNTGQTQADSHGYWLPPEDRMGMGALPLPKNLGLHWVGDLVLECTAKVEKKGGELVLVLVEGGRLFQCALDLSDGTATLSISGLEGFRPTGRTAVSKPGTYRLRFANVDDQLVLWVDGSVVQLDSPAQYDPGPDPLPDQQDLVPVRIGSRGAAVTLSHLRLFRDVYYIAQRYESRSANAGWMSDYDLPQGAADCEDHPLRDPAADPGRSAEGRDWPEGHGPLGGDPVVARVQYLAELFSDPKRWCFFQYRRQVEFALGADQFLMLGDNSPESKDSRLWEGDGAPYFVRRDLLKGKALWIYWPHSWDRIPGTDRIPFLPRGIWFPMFPNFARMVFVR
ncbi:MAG: signal peptidase I [Thermoguttaceae bacterium]